MTVTIWVDGWQMQCCGESFGPGDLVSWSLVEATPEDHADFLGDERAGAIDFREEHHGPEEHPPPSRLRVLTVTEVHCRYELPAGSTSNRYCPVPGSAELVPVEGAADGWAKARPDVDFVSYLVTAERCR
ncbi:DUF6578 domain-containing protein [Streptomyces sp. NPDC059524]|uniref:DUF6578 domain-containing protein n=1 Tax=Streptomyces sp. NPDC059524 TaxID=3346856 RepID=UPI00367BA624